MDDKGEAKNDVWLIQPCYHKNNDYLNPTTCQYRENFEKKLFLEIHKVETEGKPPLPRY
jgi:hypothetical protein